MPGFLRKEGGIEEENEIFNMDSYV